MTGIEWGEWSLDHIKENQKIFEKYLMLWDRLGFLDSVKFSNNHTLYKEPDMVDCFLFVLENLSIQYPQDWESHIPELHDIQDARKWMIQQYVAQLQKKHETWELELFQERGYEKEVNKHKEILENVDQWSMEDVEWMNPIFLPHRWHEMIEKNPDVLPHTIIRDAIHYIPKETDDIVKVLEAKAEK